MLLNDRMAKGIRAHISEIQYYNHNGKRDMTIRNMVAIKVISICSLILTIIVTIQSRPRC